MEAEGSAPAGPSGSGGVRGAGEAGRGVVGGSAPIASVSTPAKDDVKAFNLEKFSWEDWASWSFKMELLFNHYGLLEVMDGELKRPASEGSTKEWDRQSKDGFFLLSQCLSSNQLHHIKHLIKDIQCGPKAWKILKDVHAPSSEAMVVVLERQLHAVKINEGDAVQGAFDQLRDLYVKLSAAGVDYPEKIKCYKALSLLPESWGPLVVNLNGMKDSWSLEWIRAQVLQEEFRRKELTAAAGEGGGSAYGMKGFKGHGSKKGKAKEGSGGEQYSGGKRSNKGGKRCGGKCWYCHVEGHPWFKCRKLPDGWRLGQPSIEGSKGVHGAMVEGMGSEEGDGGAGGHGGMFYHVGEACSEDMVVPASKVALHPFWSCPGPAGSCVAEILFPSAIFPGRVRSWFEKFTPRSSNIRIKPAPLLRSVSAERAVFISSQSMSRCPSLPQKEHLDLFFFGLVFASIRSSSIGSAYVGLAKRPPCRLARP
ncbi:unnamed protein product [Closterium sp. NIES-53]